MALERYNTVVAKVDLCQFLFVAKQRMIWGQNSSKRCTLSRSIPEEGHKFNNPSHFVRNHIVLMCIYTCC